MCWHQVGRGQGRLLGILQCTGHPHDQNDRIPNIRHKAGKPSPAVPAMSALEPPVPQLPVPYRAKPRSPHQPGAWLCPLAGMSPRLASGEKGLVRVLTGFPVSSWKALVRPGRARAGRRGRGAAVQGCARGQEHAPGSPGPSRSTAPAQGRLDGGSRAPWPSCPQGREEGACVCSRAPKRGRRPRAGSPRDPVWPGCPLTMGLGGHPKFFTCFLCRRCGGAGGARHATGFREALPQQQTGARRAWGRLPRPAPRLSPRLAPTTGSLLEPQPSPPLPFERSSRSAAPNSPARPAAPPCRPPTASAPPGQARPPRLHAQTHLLGGTPKLLSPQASGCQPS